MRSSIALATFMALGAGTVGAGALDAVPAMVGSDTLKNLTIAVLNNCTALQGLGNPIKYDGTGSGAGENALKIIGAASTQLVAPMSRALGSGVCTGPTATQRAGAEGIVVALDGLSIIGNASNVGAEGIDYPGTAGDSANQWRTVLRLVYTGLDIASGNNVFLRDCNSAARKNIVNNWDNVFHGTVTSCTDSHPSVPGAGAAGYDQTNSIVEPGIRHAFRRDDESGTTDVFLGQLSLSGVNFAQGAPAGSNTVQAAVYRALAGSPFCNNKRPDDDWAPVTLAANATLGFNASQIPEMTNVGVPTGAGTGLGFSTQLRGSANAKNMSPYLTEYTDQDPIRRRCVGRGNNANAALPFEQVCGADGTLGVVLPITVPAELTTAEKFPSLPCEPGKGFFQAPSLTRPTTDPLRCPNGDATQDGLCFLPVRTDLTQPNGVAFDCINPPGNVPAAVVDTDGDGSQFTDAPGTDGRTDIDGRVYNLILRKPNGEIRTVTRNDPSRVGVFQTPVAAAYYRIHTTRSLLAPPLHTSSVCNSQDDATDHIGCLTLASPCSIGYAGRGGVSNNPGTVSALVNGVAPTDDKIQALVLGTSPVYPIARKLYLNTLQGFEVLQNSASTSAPNTVAGTDAEEELAKCYATLPFNGTINLQSPAIGFVNLPKGNAPSARPLCEDFNGAGVCGDTSNTDACLGNETFAGGLIPTSFCNNGLRDGAETASDVCQAGTTCNATTNHCQ